MTKPQVNNIRTQMEPISVKYTIRLDRDVSDPEDFQEELATIRAANQADVVHILINSGGGYLSTAKAFLNTLAQTDAHIITEIEGEACSAATLIFLAGHEYRVSDDATFMAHTSSYGYGGKESNVRQYVEHQAKANDRLLRKYYKHFLSDKEIDEVIEGKDIWMDADEIMERLEKRQSAMEDELGTGDMNITPDTIKDVYYGGGIDGVIELFFGEDVTKDCTSEEDEDSVSPEDLSEEIEERILFGMSAGNTSSENIKYIYRFDDGSMLSYDKSNEDFIFESYGKCVDHRLSALLDFDEIKELADDMEIIYAHNISAEKLSQRIKDFVDGHFDEF